MYVDGYLLLVIYILAASAVLISVYALWTLLEVEEQFRKNNSKKVIFSMLTFQFCCIKIFTNEQHLLKPYEIGLLIKP
jgi:hypothetical protein